MRQNWKNSKTFAKLSGPGLFNLRLFGWSYLILFIPQIAFDVVAYESSTWLWLPIWTFGHLLVGLVAYLLRTFGLDEYLTRRPSVAMNFAVAAVLGIVRVSSIGYISFQFGVAPEFDLVARIISGSILGMAFFGVFANVLATNRSYQSALRQLLATQTQIENLRRAKRKEVARLQRKLEDSTRAVIEPKLEEVARALNKGSIKPSVRRAIVNDLQFLLDNQVKPLSVRLRNAGTVLRNTQKFRKVSPIGLLKIPDRMNPDLAISPLILSLILAGIVPFSLYVFEGVSWIPLGFGIAALIGLVFWGNKFAVANRKSIPTPVGILALLGLIASQSILAYVVLVWAGFPAEGRLPVALLIFAALFFTTLSFGLIATYEYNQETFLKTLAKNNTRLERELALLNQRLWVEKREWALRIHGSVQGSLTASLVRLSGLGQLASKDLALVRAHIAQARGALKAPNLKPVDLPTSLKVIRKTWEGIVKITVNLKSASAQLVLIDKWSSVCANEIIKESVSNSVKHGKASAVKVQFETSQPGFVELVIEDNGRGLPAQFRPGLGSQILDEIAFPWSLRKLPEGGTVLRARIPVSKKQVMSKN